MKNQLKYPFERFGVECGPGWNNLIKPIFKRIEEINWTSDEQIIVEQVKEKFGSLRFYVSNAPKEIHDMIRNAEAESWNTCEKCGSRENVVHTKGWIYTLCKDCLKKMEETTGKNYKLYE